MKSWNKTKKDTLLEQIRKMEISNNISICVDNHRIFIFEKDPT